jgi:hypothetical protein
MADGLHGWISSPFFRAFARGMGAIGLLFLELLSTPLVFGTPNRPAVVTSLAALYGLVALYGIVGSVLMVYVWRLMPVIERKKCAGWDKRRAVAASRNDPRGESSI